MKKILLFLAVAVAAVSCGTTSGVTMTKVVNSASYEQLDVRPVVAVIADLKVSPTKIKYFMIPTASVANGGYNNILNSAIREALAANGDADVLVGLETQVKYSESGAVESITVTGYPAKYVNFRSPKDEVWDAETFNSAKKSAASEEGKSGFKIPFFK